MARHQARPKVLAEPVLEVLHSMMGPLFSEIDPIDDAL